MSQPSPTTPIEQMRAGIHLGGYYPDLVISALELAANGEEICDSLIHQQPTFTHDEVHRHVTVLVRTKTRLIIAHTDDYHADDPDQAAPAQPTAATSTESIPLRAISAVALTQVVSNPQAFADGSSGVETWLTVNWGVVRRVEIEPAVCGDPACEADHGFSGNIMGDDLTLRVSAAADGNELVQRLTKFGSGLQLATGLAT